MTNNIILYLKIG